MTLEYGRANITGTVFTDQVCFNKDANGTWGCIYDFPILAIESQ